DFCPVCKLYNDICMCSEIKEFNLDTRISILMHIKEKRKVSNTGKIANLCLSNSQVIYKGEKYPTTDIEDLISEDHINLILYPNATSELNKEFISKCDKPINLILLDGNYNQAGKMFRLEKTLRKAKTIHLPLGQTRKCKLRSPLHPEQISTIEAIINSLEIIGDTSANEHMEYLFNEMTLRLKKRGQNIKSI
ncbi:MAG: DTW domain-containing protein, partial [Candidatus Delongbacteria bacterium]|nr:DTW domain-containing protein [Candidatus Delongbacteria bacterium]